MTVLENTDNPTFDFHVAVNDRWCVLDLDELHEQLVLAGYPPELIATYEDPGGRRRYVRRRLRRSRSQAVAA